MAKALTVRERKLLRRVRILRHGELVSCSYGDKDLAAARALQRRGLVCIGPAGRDRHHRVTITTAGIEFGA